MSGVTTVMAGVTTVMTGVTTVMAGITEVSVSQMEQQCFKQLKQVRVPICRCLCKSRCDRWLEQMFS
jgi:hypothetical protein